VTSVQSYPSFFARNRTFLTRTVGVLIFIYVALAAPPAYLQGWAAVLSELTGFALLLAAAMGRIWCQVYIAGKKNAVLITQGPYSVVRNPLYLFNLAAAIGFGLAVEQPMLALLLAIAFVLFYPSVVAREEADLRRVFGQRYLDYAKRTPRWIPHWSNYREPDRVSVDPSIFRRGIVSATWVVSLFLLWEVIEHLHAGGVLRPLL
jgi:protein-S-isoprenylcysteine O-methyltransferase Ste14